MRDDLLALTPEAVASLANLGLVKRALKEIDQGHGPVLEEDEAGVVRGRFDDGVVAELVPGRTLRETPCSCRATVVCRHRVAVALAYRTWAAADSAGAAQAEGSVETDASSAPASAPFSPGEFDDDTLLARLGKRAFDRARDLRRSGVVIEIRRRSPSDPAPIARLPTCTVTFLVPRDLSYAQCDCATKHDCEHVALAVWGFRAADGRDPAATQLTVELRDTPAAKAAQEPLALALGLATDVLIEGAVHARDSLAQRFALSRDALQRAGFTWLLTDVDDLEELLSAYRARSSRYRPAALAELLAEIAARVRAATRPVELPSGAILGAGEAGETKLDHLRLVSLGARVEADGRDRDAEVLLADPDTSTVLVLRKRWTIPEAEEPPTAPALASRRLLTKASLGEIARGQIVTRVARRKANRLLAFGEGRGGLTSVTPQTGDFGRLPMPLFVQDLSVLTASWSARAPRLLRPRVVAENVHAMAIGAVESIAYYAGAQRFVAQLTDGAGHSFQVVKDYRAVAPHAIEHLAAALTGQSGTPRFIAGELRRHGGGLELTPLSIACDRLVVPDLERGDPPAVSIPGGRAMPPDSPVERALHAALGALEEVAHNGMLHPPAGTADRVRASARGLDACGLGPSAAVVDSLANSLTAAMNHRSPDGYVQAADAWFTAAIRLAVVSERL